MLSILQKMPILIFIGAIVFNWLSTFLGASLVYVTRKENKNLVSIALGSSAGIMIAASFFSLILPAMELLEGLNRIYLLVIPAGFLCGVLFLTLCDHFLPHEHMLSHEREGIDAKLSQNQLLMLAMTLHNIPEGLAVGVAFACASHDIIPALILSIGIGIQNFPEGTAIALPMHQYGKSKFVAMMYGQFSGIIEIPSAILGYLFATTINNILPFALCFAAGAMLFVCVEELIPEASCKNQIDIGAISCMGGFLIMMILDIMLSV